MTWNNRIVWSEGLFLRPQHFQQHTRYMEHFVEGRCERMRPFPWGFTELEIDDQLLAVGKLSLRAARGVFPDGTPFNIPDDDEPPPPLDIIGDLRDMVVYLSLPARRPGTVEVDVSGADEGLTRFEPREHEVRDSTARDMSTATVQTGALKLRLLPQSEPRGEYTCLGLAHVIEVRADKQVVLERSYIPPVMDCQAAPQLSGFLNELQGLLHHRGETLAGIVSESGRGGAAEIADFLLLQVINRAEPLASHLARLDGLHPETLFGLLVSLAGELATFTSSGKRPTVFRAYSHEDLRATYEPVIAALREAFSMQLERSATPLTLKERRFGIRVAAINDRTLIDSATFVLAVAADMPAEELRRALPAQTKIGPTEQIRELVNLQLPGILLRPLPVAPRQIPFHAGHVYFELDRSSKYWQGLKTSGGFAFHIGGDFPGLALEFWAIRG